MRSSKAAVDLLVLFEVSSKAAYEKLYSAPTWPGGSSGVTIGIGYDCGYATHAAIESDWGPYLPTGMITALQRTTGLTGEKGHSATLQIKHTVDVPWDAAMAVFMQRDMPKWENSISRSLANTEHLSGDSFGALVSLAYNRGTSFNTSGDRYREMRNIKNLMISQMFNDIPAQIRSMRRLWPTVRGLRIRRDKEANLFQNGLTNRS